MSISRSTHALLSELGYSFVATATGGEIRNAANDVITSLGVAEVRVWLNGVTHGLSNRTSCIHEPTDTTEKTAHAKHTKELPSCPWCIVVRKDRELEALRSALARLEGKGKKRG